MAYLTEKRRKNPATGKIEAYFQLAWREGGRGSRARSEALGFVAPKEARELLKLKEVELLRAERAPPTIEPASPPAWTVARLLDERLIVHLRARDCRPKTIESAECSAKNLKARLGGVLVRDLASVQIDAYVVARREDGRSPKTIRNELQALTQALRLAVDDGEIKEVPKIHRPRKERALPVRFHTPDQSAALVREALRGKDPVSALAVVLATEIGARRGEILTRGWEDVDWSARALHIRAKPAINWTIKAGDARTVPLSDGVYDLLRAAWDHAGQPPMGWIFPSPRDPAKPRGNFKGALKFACERAGLPHLNPHALRHSFASRMAAKRVPRVVTAAIGGWSPTSAVLSEVYELAIPDQVRAAAALGSVLVIRADQTEGAAVLSIENERKKRAKQGN